MSAEEQTALFRALLTEQGLSFPGITSTPGVNGGEPSIIRTRIAAWMPVQVRQLGAKDAEILRFYPSLYAEDLTNAWAYYRAHRDLIAVQIAENEAA